MTAMCIVNTQELPSHALTMMGTLVQTINTISRTFGPSFAQSSFPAAPETAERWPAANLNLQAAKLYSLNSHYPRQDV
jgi:hypothetical protein